MTIGQRLADAVPYIDYIAPMVYPSHYPDNFLEYANPALYPYEVIYGSMKKGIDILASYDAQMASTTQTASTTVTSLAHSRVNLARRLRPWIQDFNLGTTYTPPMVRKELQAANDAGSSGWMLWNSRNIYTEKALASTTQPSINSLQQAASSMHNF